MYQDLPPGDDRVALLLRNFVYPAWLRSTPVCFFSSAGIEEYAAVDRLSVLLHTDVGAIERALAGEQLVRILELQHVRAERAFECTETIGEDPAGPRRVDGAPVALPSADSDVPLDDSQEIAVAHRSGPMCVLAPAGSGKTRTIVSRISRLVRDGVPPGSILPLAFNRKAAAEMNTRLGSLGLGDVRARTLHSLGYEIVRRETGCVFADDPVIASGGAAGATAAATKQSHILTRALRSVYPDHDTEEVSKSGSGVRTLSAVKMNLLDPDRLQIVSGGESLSFGPVFRRCLEIQAERRLIDYDDMVYIALRILLDDSSARRAWQERWTHLLVDEFQDLNPSQMLLLRILTHPTDNLFVVGDDDQSIYGWRGASVRGLLDFRAAWPSAAVCVLSTNYRSASRIVAHAGWLIARNNDRVPKHVMVRRGAPPGEFLVRLAPGLRAQAREAARWIEEEKHGSTRRWSDFAVLYRYNALAFIVTIALEERGIPHDFQNTALLFASRAGQDVIAWLRCLLGRPARGDLTRVLSRPGRILPYALASGLDSREDLLQLLQNYAHGDRQERLLRQFLESTTRLGAFVHALAAGEFLEELDRAAGFRAGRRRRRVPGGDPDEADDATCFDVIQAMAGSERTAEDFLAYAEELLNSAPAPAVQTGTRNGVVLSTVHRAKGNEYSRVVFFDMSRRHRLTGEEIEEERRVAYVGLTRARDALLVTADARRQSPFLRESSLNPEYDARMRDDLVRELRGLRRRYRRASGKTRTAPRGADPALLRPKIDSLEEELLCRSMLNAHAP